MDKEKRCRVCNFPLHSNNWSETRKKKNDYICSLCKSKELKSIVVPETIVDKEGYTISRVGQKAPTICATNTCNISIKDMINATELYRVEQVLKLIASGTDAKVRKVCIDYLLKVSELLTSEQLASVVNEANLMMLQAGVDDEIKLKVAITLRNFVSTKEGKTGKPKSYEELLKGDKGEIEIDDEI